MERKTLSYFIYCILLAVLVLPAGCGYHIRKTPPVDSVRLGRILNNTTEPRLQDRLYEALSLSLMKNGIRIENNSQYTLKGSINDVKLRGTAEQVGVTIQYEVRISGDFVLLGPDGKARELHSSDVFIVTFSSAGALENVLAQKEEAIKTALGNMADRIVTSILH